MTTKYSYDEFGIPSPNSKFGQGGEKANTYGFTGEQWDEDVGLLYLRARYYQPDVGRFITKDPFPGITALSQTLPPYLYCQNNPTDLVDPQGRIAPLLVAVLGGAAAGAFAGGLGYLSGLAISNAVNGKPLFSGFSRTDLALSAAGGAVGGVAITVTGVTTVGATAIGAGVSAGQYLAGSWIKGEEITFGGYVSSIVSGSVAGLIGGSANVSPLYGFVRGTIGETVSPFIANAIDYQLSQYNIYGVPRPIDPVRMYLPKGGQ